jgi:uncharacterized protein
VRRPALRDDGGAEHRPAPAAGQSCSSVGVQLRQVPAALPVDELVVAEARPLPFDRCGQYLADRVVQAGGPLASDAAGVGMDARAPQRLIGVDVAHPCDQPLVEQTGLHAGTRAREPPREPLQRERVRERFRSERGERRRSAGVVPGVDDRDASEAARVTEHDGLTVVEHEPDPDVPARGIDPAFGVLAVEDPDDPRHAEMDDQLRWMVRRRTIERQQEELPAAVDAEDPSAHGPVELAEPTRWVRVAHGGDDRPTGDERHQLTPDGFDLGELGHTTRLVPAPSLSSVGCGRDAVGTEEVAVPADPGDRPGSGDIRDPRDRRDRREDGRPEQSRPRDRTGRPLPHGTTGVLLIEAVEPSTVQEAVVLGAARWDECRYFEAHELLEHAWKGGPTEDRDLWKGVIQVAVAGVHLQRGNRIGARRLLDRAEQRLRRLPDPDAARDVDVARLLRTTGEALRVLDSGGVPEADWGPFPARVSP